MKITTKIIASKMEKIIGWKGNVLEVSLDTNSPEALSAFFENYLAISASKLTLSRINANTYEVSIDSKYEEDPVILFS